MIKTKVTRFLILVGIVLLCSCKDDAPQNGESGANSLTPEQKVEVQALVESGQRLTKIYNELPGLMGQITDDLSLELAQKKLNTISTKRQRVVDQLRGMPKPSAKVRLHVHAGLKKEKEKVQKKKIEALKIAETLPSELAGKASISLMEFLQGKSDESEIIASYFEPHAPAKKPENLASNVTAPEKSIPESTPLDPEPESTEPARLPAEIVPE